MIDSDPPPSSGRGAVRFQGRGMLLGDALYIERAADRELAAALARGEHCHVLAPRQVGKSNLRVRVAALLRRRGVHSASVDLTGVGSRASEEQFYYGLCRFIADRLGLDEGGGLPEFWAEHAALSCPQRWSEFLRQRVMPLAGGPVVVFLDEIDVTLGLGFSRDDFFRSIRFIQDARGDEPLWRWLTFCLLGVVSPTELVEDARLTPFNKSRAVQLEDFTRAELAQAREGLGPAGGDPGALLDEVFSWTHGHPALTQQLCERLVFDGPLPGVDERERVRALVDEMYLQRGRGDDPILAEIDRRFGGTDAANLRASRLIEPYARLLREGRLPVDGGSQMHAGLRIAGLAAERADETGKLFIMPRNRVIATVFNEAWVDERLRDRRYSDPIARWLQHGKGDAYALKGEQLAEALETASSRDDVTPSEFEFLLTSQKLDRARAQNRWLFAFALALGMAAASLASALIWKGRTQQALERQVEIARYQVDAAASLLKEAEREATALARLAESAKARADEAEHRAAQDAERERARADYLDQQQQKARERLEAAGKLSDDAKRAVLDVQNDAARTLGQIRAIAERNARAAHDAAEDAARMSRERDGALAQRNRCEADLEACRAGNSPLAPAPAPLAPFVTPPSGLP
ncbi:MAG: AAA-like domain-containing protein [Polyangiaceae bacterium]|nr:AAA-like domain-containing protein [Polyangiaceae bacterium]